MIIGGKARASPLGAGEQFSSAGFWDFSWGSSWLGDFHARSRFTTGYIRATVTIDRLASGEFGTSRPTDSARHTGGHHKAPIPTLTGAVDRAKPRWRGLRSILGVFRYG